MSWSCDSCRAIAEEGNGLSNPSWATPIQIARMTGKYMTAHRHIGTCKGRDIASSLPGREANTSVFSKRFTVFSLQYQVHDKADGKEGQLSLAPRVRRWGRHA